MRGRRGGLLGSLVLLMLLPVTACADDSSQQDRLANPRRPDSVNATVGDIRLIAVRIEAPDDELHIEGDNTGLFLTIANGGDNDDTLIAASTVDAQSIVFRDGDEPPADRINVEIPAGDVASLQYPGGPHLELVELKRDVRGSSFMPVAFRFDEAGTITVNVFVQGFGRPTVAPSS